MQGAVVVVRARLSGTFSFICDQKAIAVVAGGVDSVYPPENAELYARIAAEGLIIGEMRIGTKPQARHFPSRNRIIAGLSLGFEAVFDNLVGAG